MEYFSERQMDYYNHQELHEIQMIVKDKDCLSCEKCYPIREEVPRVFEKVWGILKKFESNRIMESIRYNEQPNFKEKGLRQVLVVIARDCIENNKENVVCDGLIGNPELVKYGYILEEWDVKIRFEKFWMWRREQQ
ncbi:hypothetical protein GLOIN_2v1886091 [Rhizophagus clarus]|uniref:Uncharacterized protein n=1 Tax=Rhizophagus clarus TaxID=94130 RepID=A0A8H3M4R5_9GLOM|nr:hypothetical protein GLOIN_2v1886091 [Rhizophagus clarus]